MIPKFRVWDGEDQVMQRVEGLLFPKISQIYEIDVIIYDEEYSLGPDLVLMQSTGLKDKSGVEIFEGDILEKNFQTINGGISKLRYSVFQEQTGAWRVKNPNGTLSNVFDLKKAAEVIGNIYENPDLLKVH